MWKDGIKMKVYQSWEGMMTARKPVWMIFTETREIPNDPYSLVPFNQLEIEAAKDNKCLFGHLYEETSNDLMMNRTFTYVSTMIL